MGRILSADDPASPLDSGQRHEAAEASRFSFCRLFDQLSFFERVIGKHFGSQWSFGSAPGRNVVVVLGHRKRMIPLASALPTESWPRSMASIWDCLTGHALYRFCAATVPRVDRLLPRTAARSGQ
jgi:hypothetical protein